MLKSNLIKQDKNLIQDIITQKIHLKKKYDNSDLLVNKYFKKITGIYPKNIIRLQDFIFFFIEKKMYHIAKNSISQLRRKFKGKKVMIIKQELTLIDQVHSLFPDLKIKDTRIEQDFDHRCLNLILLFNDYKERGIAIGKKGGYIKALNQLVKEFLILENVSGVSVKIYCQMSI